MTTPSVTDSACPVTRILSIQSSVVHGYVGNKASMFPLQLLGFGICPAFSSSSSRLSKWIDVSPINTVQFSNHTGYQTWTGHKFTGSHLEEIIGGLMANHVADYPYILTGYVGNIDLLESLANLLPSLKSNPMTRFFCDPVMGDSGRLYVPGGFVDVYRKKIVPLADVLLPNQTEAEYLTGKRINSAHDAAEACRLLHDLGPKIVIITSLDQNASNHIETFVSESGRGCWRFWVDRIEGAYYGTGDTLAALCLAWLHRYPVERAVELALRTLRAIIGRTHAAGSNEILLIQSRDDILNPLRLPEVPSEAYCWNQAAPC